LLAIADLLKAQVRSSDIACRYGGEEFLLVLPGTTAEAAFERAEQLRLLCAEIRIAHQNMDLSITVSMGIATYPIHAKDSEELLIHADIALYTSKHSGRNKVAIWSKA
jgi:diguanylate cyclase (GGDEF)-like protein